MEVFADIVRENMKVLTQDIDLNFSSLGAAGILCQDGVGSCVLLGDCCHLQLEVMPLMRNDLAFI